MIVIIQLRVEKKMSCQEGGEGLIDFTDGYQPNSKDHVVVPQVQKFRFRFSF